MRALSRDFARSARQSFAFRRGLADGQAFDIPAYSREVEVEAFATDAPVRWLMRKAGFEVSVSDAGRRTSRIIGMLDGVESTLTTHPSVREVLDLAAGPRSGKPARALLGAAKRHAGDWPSQLGPWQFGDVESYAQWILGRLCYLRVLEGHLQFVCSVCGLSQLVPADRLGKQIACADCEKRSELAVEIVRGAEWRFKSHVGF